MPSSPGPRTSDATIEMPPSTAVSEPVPGPSPMYRPSSRRRPKTGKPRRPPSARPDTSASGIGDLPDQEFFPEGDDLDEEDEDYYDEEDEEDNPFAYKAPFTAAGPRTEAGPSQTAAVPVVAFSDTNPSAPNTGNPSTSGEASVPIGLRKRLSVDAPYEPTGPVDIAGHINQPEYDPRNPPAMSGRKNPNNSIFSFSMNSKAGSIAGSTAPSAAGPGDSSRGGANPVAGQTVSDRRRRGLNTATTGMTDTTHLTVTSAARTGSSWQSDFSDAASLSDAEMTRESYARRIRSNTRLVDEHSIDFTSGRGLGRAISRNSSIGLTDITGDPTVADGKTTWGDGVGPPAPVAKDGSEEGSVGDVGWDPMEEDSPYPEVRASVSNIDDPNMPVFTIRAAILGIFFVVLCSAFNTFFFFRFPAPNINAFIIEMIVYPFGCLAAKVLPITVHTLPTWMPGPLSGKQWSLNPCPFNVKEHALIVIMANVGVTQAYGLHLVVAGQLFYGKAFGFGFGFLLILCSQLLGFSLAGLTRRFVISPASMIWPEALVVSANLNAFHAEEDTFQGGMPRLRFLCIAIAASTAYAWLPSFLFVGLAWFNWPCWIAPTNRTVNTLFGSNFGLGMGALTFDWNQVTWIANPLVIPWWAQVNIFAGFVLFFWIICPIIYFTNTWYSAYLPINTQAVGDRFGANYDVYAVLDQNLSLNQTAYEAYSPVYISAALGMTYTVAFALTLAMLVHTALWHGPRMWGVVRNRRIEPLDIHAKLMAGYREVPSWWYGIVFVTLFALSIVCIQVFDTDLPVWGFIVALLLPIIYFLPSAFLYATTAQIMTLNLIAQLVPGFLLPGRPIAVMLCKTFSLQLLSQGLVFVQDQKLGHYMKIPPRATFIAQFSAAIIACLVQISVKTLLFAHVPGICDDGRTDGLTCDVTKTFFSSTVVWGLIGPARLWHSESFYQPQIYALIAGAIAPVMIFFLARRWPQSWIRNFNLPVFLNGPLNVPPATGINYGSFFIAGFIFQFWVRRRNFAWWSKYNYVLAAGLDVGTALGAIMIFLCIGLTGTELHWFGNDAYLDTADWTGDIAHLLLPEEGYFGPSTWK